MKRKASWLPEEDNNAARNGAPAASPTALGAAGNGAGQRAKAPTRPASTVSFIVTSFRIDYYITNQHFNLYCHSPALQDECPICYSALGPTSVYKCRSGNKPYQLFCVNRWKKEQADMQRRSHEDGLANPTCPTCRNDITPVPSPGTQKDPNVVYQVTVGSSDRQTRSQSAIALGVSNDVQSIRNSTGQPGDMRGGGNSPS